MRVPEFEDVSFPVSFDGPLEESIRTTAESLVAALRETGQTITFAESCTGGLAAKSLTDIPGASDVFECGFITYSNRIKQEVLGVDGDLLSEHGPVNPETAVFMAEGACRVSGADIGVSVTGVAGPGPEGEHEEGEIYIALHSRNRSFVARLATGTENRRDYNRQVAALTALNLAGNYINGSLKEG